MVKLHISSPWILTSRYTKQRLPVSLNPLRKPHGHDIWRDSEPGKKKRCDALRANLPCFHLNFLPASQAKRTLEANVPNFSSLNFPDSFFCIHVGPSVRISAAAHGRVRFHPRCSSFCLSSSLRASSTV